jgi:hypothetical protein
MFPIPSHVIRKKLVLLFNWHSNLAFLSARRPQNLDTTYVQNIG